MAPGEAACHFPRRGRTVGSHGTRRSTDGPGLGVTARHPPQGDAIVCWYRRVCFGLAMPQRAQVGAQDFKVAIFVGLPFRRRHFRDQLVDFRDPLIQQIKTVKQPSMIGIMSVASRVTDSRQPAREFQKSAHRHRAACRCYLPIAGLATWSVPPGTDCGSRVL